MHSLTLIVPSSFVQNSTSPATAGRAFVLIVLALAWVAVSPTSRAQAYEGDLGNGNTAEGFQALLMLTSGAGNTAIGGGALQQNTTGSGNTATGGGALSQNTTAGSNTATGVNALGLNTTGGANTANGFFALLHNTSGIDNTATGDSALLNNTTGSYNTANGFDALFNNTNGTANTAIGSFALVDNQSGNNNTAGGDGALFNNTTGGNNTASGVDALLSNTTGTNNIGFGFLAGSNLTTGSNNIDIGANVPGVAGEANTIRIGKSGIQKKTFIAGIRGVTVASGVGVIVSSSGQLGTVTSSARFKEAIKPMDKASEALLALQPVTFRYKHELDPDGVSQFGLVAEQVEKVNPDLVVRDEDGNVNTVRYEAVNAMLLNEFLKAHRKLEEQEAIITRLESKLANREVAAEQQQKQIEALTATVQKVSDKVALGQAAPQLVANP